MRLALVSPALICAWSALARAEDPAAQPWDRFVGCYDAIEANGAPVQPGVAYKSRMVFGESPLFKTVRGAPIQSLSLSVVQSDDSGADMVSAVEFAFVWTPGASYTQDRAGVHFAYKGEVRDRIQEEIYPLTLSMDLSQPAGQDSLITVRATRNGESSSYTLRKAANCVRD